MDEKKVILDDIDYIVFTILYYLFFGSLGICLGCAISQLCDLFGRYCLCMFLANPTEPIRQHRPSAGNMVIVRSFNQLPNPPNHPNCVGIVTPLQTTDSTLNIPDDDSSQDCIRMTPPGSVGHSTLEMNVLETPPSEDLSLILAANRETSECSSTPPQNDPSSILSHPESLNQVQISSNEMLNSLFVSPSTVPSVEEMPKKSIFPKQNESSTPFVPDTLQYFATIPPNATLHLFWSSSAILAPSFSMYNPTNEMSSTPSIPEPLQYLGTISQNESFHCSTSMVDSSAPSISTVAGRTEEMPEENITSQNNESSIPFVPETVQWNVATTPPNGKLHLYWCSPVLSAQSASMHNLTNESSTHIFIPESLYYIATIITKESSHYTIRMIDFLPPSISTTVDHTEGILEQSITSRPNESNTHFLQTFVQYVNPIPEAIYCSIPLVHLSDSSTPTAADATEEMPEESVTSQQTEFSTLILPTFVQYVAPIRQNEALYCSKPMDHLSAPPTSTMVHHTEKLSDMSFPPSRNECTLKYPEPCVAQISSNETLHSSATELAQLDSSSTSTSSTPNLTTPTCQFNDTGSFSTNCLKNHRERNEDVSEAQRLIKTADEDSGDSSDDMNKE